MRRIRLTNGKYAFVDDGRYEELRQYRWQARKHRHSGTWYAVRRQNGKTVQMHRQVLNAPNGVQVDHRNGNGLDNRRRNLRLATSAQNNQNRRKGRNNTTGYKGVSRQNGRKKFRAQIYVNGRAVYLGWFDKPREAACIYDRAARELHGEFARTNF